jgi:hypothetical protein
MDRLVIHVAMPVVLAEAFKRAIAKKALGFDACGQRFASAHANKRASSAPANVPTMLPPTNGYRYARIFMERYLCDCGIARRGRLHRSTGVAWVTLSSATCSTLGIKVF